MPIFRHPQELTLVAHFSVPRVQTWGNSSKDRAFKQQVQRASRLSPAQAQEFEWYAFCIRCIVPRSRDLPKQVPDVENIPKLIVDAFTGLLYEDDHLHHVRGVQVEAEWGEEERTEVWIYGQPRAIRG